MKLSPPPLQSPAGIQPVVVRQCPHSAPQTRRRVNTTVARGHAPEAPAVIIVLIEKAHQRSARARGRQDRGRRHTQGGPPLTISFRPLLPFFDARIPTRTFDATCDATDPPRAAHASAPPAGETRGGSRPSSFEKHAFCSHSRPLTAILPLSLLSINRSHGSRMTSRSIRVSSSPSARFSC